MLSRAQGRRNWKKRGMRDFIVLWAFVRAVKRKWLRERERENGGTAFLFEEIFKSPKEGNLKQPKVFFKISLQSLSFFVARCCWLVSWLKYMKGFCLFSNEKTLLVSAFSIFNFKFFILLYKCFVFCPHFKAVFLNRRVATHFWVTFGSSKPVSY